VGATLLYCAMREWWVQRQMMGALGVKNVDGLDELLDQVQEIGVGRGRRRRAVDRATRSRNIAAFVAAAGM